MSRTGAQRANQEFSCQLCPPPSRRGSLLSPSPCAEPHLVLHLVGPASLPACSIIPTRRSRPPAGLGASHSPAAAKPASAAPADSAGLRGALCCAVSRSVGLCVYAASHLGRSHLPTVGCCALDHLMRLRVGGFPRSLTG